jgi:hypothetical protein
MTGYHLAALIVFTLWGGAVLFVWLKFRTAIFGGRAGRLYRAHQREVRMLARARLQLQSERPYGDASTYMIGERNG